MKPIERIKEPSTWAGFAGILLGLKTMFPQHGAILDGLAMVAGAAGAMIPEKGK